MIRIEVLCRYSDRMDCYYGRIDAGHLVRMDLGLIPMSENIDLETVSSKHLNQSVRAHSITQFRHFFCSSLQQPCQSSHRDGAEDL